MADADFVKELLRKAFSEKEVSLKKIIYTGHGVPLTGSWCLEDSEFSIKDMNDLIAECSEEPKCDIIVNSCFSHLWQYSWHKTFPPKTLVNIAAEIGR